jgi:CYTH domain-containing protein
MALEIERKFLVLDDSYKEQAYANCHIRQGYICSERGRTVRIRIRDEHAYITIKGPSLNGGLTRYEFEQEIPLDDARILMTLCEPGGIDKTRWLVRSGNHTFEVDEFHGDNAGLVVAEVELSSDNESFVKPSFIGQEVTGDRRYYNSQLRRNPYRLWSKLPQI